MIEAIKQLRLLYENALTIKRMNSIKSQLESTKINYNHDSPDSLDYSRIQFQSLVNSFVQINSLPKDLEDFKVLSTTVTEEINNDEYSE